jgi:hypothetical protein
MVLGGSPVTVAASSKVKCVNGIFLLGRDSAHLWLGFVIEAHELGCVVGYDRSSTGQTVVKLRTEWGSLAQQSKQIKTEQWGDFLVFTVWFHFFWPKPTARDCIALVSDVLTN